MKIIQFFVGATAKANNETYRSNINNEVNIKAVTDFEFDMTSNLENKEVGTGDIITYTIKIKREKSSSSTPITVQDTIPFETTLRKATVIHEDGQTEELEIKNNEFSYIDDFITGEMTIILETIVNYSPVQTEDIEISNKASLLGTLNKELGTSREIKNTIKAPSQNNPNNPSNPDNPYNPDNPNNPSNPDNPYNPGGNNQNANRSIYGIAWIDSNLNGAKDDFENTVPNIPVKLLDPTANDFVKDSNGNDIQAYTDDKGFYQLSNVPQGTYIVLFEYDTTQYSVTEYKKEGVDETISSKVLSKTLKINNQEKTYAITDIVRLGEVSLSNINIGLITKGKFDLSLDKYISKIVVSTNDEVKTYNYNKETLAKVELSGKKIDGANVIIEYDIVVTNNGEVSGYARKIQDQIPSDLKFSSELNQDWYQSGTALTTNSLENEVIVPGESKTIKLVLTKSMTSDNTGIVTNTAEILDSYNEEGIADVNSTPGNGNQSEDDMGSADVIISIKTGSALVYTAIILIIVVMTGIAVYIIRKDTLLLNEDIFKGL